MNGYGEQNRESESEIFWIFVRPKCAEAVNQLLFLLLIAWFNGDAKLLSESLYTDHSIKLVP